MPEQNFISFNPVVTVDGWDRTEELPTGTREKVTLIDPETGGYYIFKYPKERREHQIWSELLASYIAGDLLDWEVQHTSIAERGGRLGNLLGYIFEPGTADKAQETFTEGWTLCTEMDPEFDVDKGTRHTLPLLMQVAEKVQEPEFGVSKECFLDFWARALALDTLISNTDRHAENWAIIRGPAGARMAPLYDNGSSLGCGIDIVGLDRVFDSKGRITSGHLDKQFKNGRHHVRVEAPHKHGGLFVDVCSEFLRLAPGGRHWFEQVEAVDIDKICDLMDSISTDLPLDEAYFLSEKRQQHICAMLQIGRERIRNALR